MIHPNIDIIINTTLVVNGFTEAKVLTSKILQFIDIFTKLFPDEATYDLGKPLYTITTYIFLINTISGLRNLMLIMKNCVEQKLQLTEDDNQSEEEIIYHSFINSIGSKLKSSDLELFTSTIQNLFTTENISNSKPVHKTFDEHYFSEFIHSENLQLSANFHRKIIETYERVFNQSGVALVGNPFTGKSTILKLLIYIFQQESGMNEEKKDIQIGMFTIKKRRDKNNNKLCILEFVNPKSIDSQHLFGSYDSINKEWTEGIVTYIFRNFFETPNKKQYILVFDGPIDSEWIENLNSLIDDNQNFCLKSSETIHLNENSSIIFETDNLCRASPSTVRLHKIPF